MSMDSNFNFEAKSEVTPSGLLITFLQTYNETSNTDTMSNFDAAVEAARNDLKEIPIEARKDAIQTLLVWFEQQLLAGL